MTTQHDYGRAILAVVILALAVTNPAALVFFALAALLVAVLVVVGVVLVAIAVWGGITLLIGMAAYRAVVGERAAKRSPEPRPAPEPEPLVTYVEVPPEPRLEFPPVVATEPFFVTDAFSTPPAWESLAPLPMPSAAQVTVPPKVPSARSLKRKDPQALVALAKELGVQGASPKWKKDTLIQAILEASRS